jgi:hypothetical protein
MSPSKPCNSCRCRRRPFWDDDRLQATGAAVTVRAGQNTHKTSTLKGRRTQHLFVVIMIICFGFGFRFYLKYILGMCCVYDIGVTIDWVVG